MRGSNTLIDCERGRWRSQEDLDKHHERAYLKETHRKLEEEDLLTGPEVIRVVERVYGF